MIMKFGPQHKTQHQLKSRVPGSNDCVLRGEFISIGDPIFRVAFVVNMHRSWQGSHNPDDPVVSEPVDTGTCVSHWGCSMCGVQTRNSPQASVLQTQHFGTERLKQEPLVSQLACQKVKRTDTASDCTIPCGCGLSKDCAARLTEAFSEGVNDYIWC